MSDLATRVHGALTALDVEFTVLGSGQWGVVLPSQARGSLTVALRGGERTLHLTAFLMRAPDRHHEAVYARMLTKNLTMYRWAFALDELGDVYLTARVPEAAVDEALMDELLGLGVVYADEVYDVLVRTGFDIPPGVSLSGPPTPPAPGAA